MSKQNAVHGSDGPETAAAEIAFFFKPDEVLSIFQVKLFNRLARHAIMKPNIKDLSFKEFEAYLLERKQPRLSRPAGLAVAVSETRRDFVRRDDQSVGGPCATSWTQDFTISRLAVERQADSRDGTVKFLFRARPTARASRAC